MASFLRHASLILTIINYSTLVSAALPAYSGTYGVGTIALEVPVADPRNITDTVFKATKQPAFKLDTTLINVYYPIDKNTKSTKPQHPWLSVSADLIAKGLSDSLNGSISPALIEIGFGIFASDLAIPAEVDVNFLPGNESFPVMIFSHGNPTMTDWYSQYYGEMASRGVVIAGVAHRDGSSPATVVKFKNGTSYNVTAFTQDVVSPTMNDTEFHRRQLEMRQAEFIEVTRTLQSIANGDGQAVFSANSRSEGQALAQWKGRIDMNRTIIAGHSFGSNAVLRYLQDSKPLVPAVAALPFDPGKDSGPLPTDVSLPILIPDSEEWSAKPTPFYGSQHFDVVKSIAASSLNKTGAGWFMTLRTTTVHTSLTDVGLIASSFVQFFTNDTSLITLDPKVALLQYVAVSGDFLTYVSNKTITGLLATNVTYPTFKLFPNASVLKTPWEVHVAPTVPGTAASKSGAGRIRLELGELSVWVIMLMYVMFCL
ncbi:hypothetical protein BT63DRAFT_425386 [Microthyrium microscopicum]|uniref:Putative phospholipase n=1 Tax=Microthyrium microscopicum TaxID=703497 RepID=A0A6A6UCW4_9PEZI|nr:hypothetical protein BT63DRAFT_425386 [Microthyrium microscopicum]